MSETFVFDRSSHVRVQLVGRDAARFLHNLSTNDIVNLPPHRGCEAFFCSPKAKVVFHALVWNLTDAGEATFWLDAGPGSSERIVKHLDHYLISERVEIVDRTHEFSQYRVVGAGARDVLRGIVNGEVNEAKGLCYTPATLADGTACHVFAHDLLGQPTYDLVVPRGRPLDLKLSDDERYEVLRVEMGLPEFGKELDENRFVAEVGRTARAISYTKGCYLGQEPVVMARDRGHVNRFLVGLKLDGDGLAVPGGKVLHDEREVGRVTSSVQSPRFGPIALAYVWRGSHEPGTIVRVENRTATVRALPFDHTT